MPAGTTPTLNFGGGDAPAQVQGHVILAIERLLVLREQFQLPHRQTEGLGDRRRNWMELEIAIPDYTSLVKRAALIEDVAGRPDALGAIGMWCGTAPG